MSKTEIEWTDASWNPIRRRVTAQGQTKFSGHFCVKVSDGCTNCYAERMQPRFGHPVRYAAQEQSNVEIYLDEKELLAPLRWRKPRMIFVGSMTDIFGDWVSAEWLDKLYAVMALCPQHTFQVLTKRPERMREYLSKNGYLRQTCRAEIMLRINPAITQTEMTAKPWPLTNVWHGVSVENQDTANERIPHLLNTPSAIRFISAEPLLGHIDLAGIEIGGDMFWGTLDALNGKEHGHYMDGGHEWDAKSKLDWVIVGGESGSKARPMRPDWAEGLRNQCKESDTAFFFKQWGEWLPEEYMDEAEARASYLPDLNAGRTYRFGGTPMRRLGKKAAGRLLDGVEHNAMPEAK